jgi:hypothetical protein
MNLMKKYLVSTLLLLFILSSITFNGCKNKSSIKQSSLLEENSIKKWFIEKNNMEINNINLIEIKHSENVENKAYYFYTFIYNNNKYESISYINDNKIQNTDYVIIDSKVPFTKHQYSMKTDNALEVYTTGFINNRSISYVVINYKNDVLVQIEPFDGCYYSDLSNFAIKEIIAYDDNLKEIYKY